MWKLLGGAAKHLCEPADSFLMRYVHEVVAAKDVRQAVFAGVRLVMRHLLRRPKVPPPSHICQQNEKRERGCQTNRGQDSSSHARKSRRPNSQRDLVSSSNFKLSAAEHHETDGLIEILLERSSSADIQGNAMGPPAQHLGVPQFQGDYIKSLLF